MKKGIDAPLGPIMFIAVGIFGIVMAWRSQNPYNFIFPAVMFVMALLFIHTSLRGKYQIIHNVVNSLNIPKNSKVLDLGTGHGAVLLEVAQHLEQPGEVIGIDIWQSADQSSNSSIATQQNIDRTNVNDVAKIKTADMTQLPFNNEQFDYVFASLAIHNVKPKSHRQLAIREALRVLKPNGHLVIIDMEHVGEFKQYLVDQGCQAVHTHHAGINGIWGWLPTSVVIAQK